VESQVNYATVNYLMCMMVWYITHNFHKSVKEKQLFFFCWQTRLVDSMVAVDSSSQSMLEFTGHRNVHGLYDFLLNHRSVIYRATLRVDSNAICHCPD
jgi:hypothetical protein